MSCTTSLILGRAGRTSQPPARHLVHRVAVLTLSKETLDNLGGLLVHLVECALDLASNPPDPGTVLTSAGLKQARILLRDLLEYFDEACIAPDRIAIQFAHMRARCSAVSNDIAGQKTLNALLNLAEEPPLGDIPDDGQGEDELAAADQREAEECSAADDFRVVQVPSKSG